MMIAMPGVPSEMKRMYEAEVAPRLPTGSQVIRRVRIHAFGVGESHAEELLGDLTARGRDPEIGITVHQATITLRINAIAASPDACEQKVAVARAMICERLGTLVFGEEDEELQHVVVRLLSGRQQTVAVAESGTAGLLGSLLAQADGSGTAFAGSCLVPTSRSRQALRMPVSDGTGQAVSAQVAQEMARGCREIFGTDYALSVTDHPPHDPDDATTVPRSWIAVASADGVSVHEHVLLGDEQLARIRAAKTALNLLRLELLRLA